MVRAPSVEEHATEESSPDPPLPPCGRDIACHDGSRVHRPETGIQWTGALEDEEERSRRIHVPRRMPVLMMPDESHVVLLRLAQTSYFSKEGGLSQDWCRLDITSMFVDDDVSKLLQAEVQLLGRSNTS